MTITEHRLNIVHQIEELSEDSLIELERIIAKLKLKQNQYSENDMSEQFNPKQFFSVSQSVKRY